MMRFKRQSSTEGHAVAPTISDQGDPCCMDVLQRYRSLKVSGFFSKTDTSVTMGHK